MCFLLIQGRVLSYTVLDLKCLEGKTLNQSFPNSAYNNYYYLSILSTTYLQQIGEYNFPFSISENENQKLIEFG